MFSFWVGLKLLHRVGWVHRDLSPSNLVICGGKCRILNLEYARRYVGDQTPSSASKSVGLLRLLPFISVFFMN